MESFSRNTNQRQSNLWVQHMNRHQTVRWVQRLPLYYDITGSTSKRQTVKPLSNRDFFAVFVRDGQTSKPVNAAAMPNERISFFTEARSAFSSVSTTSSANSCANEALACNFTSSI